MSNPYKEAAAVLLKESGCTVGTQRKSNTGRAHRDREWTIDVPEPRGPVSFGVFAHEIAHQLLHRTGSRPRWLEEIEAEEWALAQFERFGLLGHERYEKNAALHLGYTFAKTARRSKSAAARILSEHREWWDRAEAAHIERDAR